jgi:hypothetical protein
MIFNGIHPTAKDSCSSCDSRSEWKVGMHEALGRAPLPKSCLCGRRWADPETYGLRSCRAEMSTVSVPAAMGNGEEKQNNQQHISAWRCVWGVFRRYRVVACTGCDLIVCCHCATYRQCRSAQRSLVATSSRSISVWRCANAGGCWGAERGISLDVCVCVPSQRVESKDGERMQGWRRCK